MSSEQDLYARETGRPLEPNRTEQTALAGEILAVLAQAAAPSSEESHLQRQESNESKETNSQESSGLNSIRHVNFVIASGAQRVIWLPKGVDVHEKSARIFSMALEHWKLRRPSMLLRFQSGFAHPKFLLDEDELKKLREDHPLKQKLRRFSAVARQMFENTSTSQDHSPQAGLAHRDNSSQDLEQEAIKHLNQYLYDRLLTLTHMLLMVAAEANCWIVTFGVAGGMVILEEALKLCKIKPVVLVMDSPREKRYWEKYPRSKEMTQKLIDHMEPLDTNPKTVLLGTQFWQPKDGPSVQKGWDQQSSKDKGADEIPWNQWIFRGGTHYILSESPGAWLDEECLAPSATLYLSGGQSSRQDIIRSLKRGQPLVAIDNVGRASMSFATELRRLFERDVDGDGKLDLPPPDENDLGFLTEFSEFSAAEREALSSLFARDGQRICYTCTVLDPLANDLGMDSGVEDQIALCLSNGAFLAVSGSNRDLDRTRLAWAWHLYQQLSDTARKQWIYATLFGTMLLFLNVLSVILSLYLQEVKSRQEVLSYRQSAAGGVSIDNEISTLRDVITVATWVLPIMPAASTLLLTLTSRFDFQGRWSKMASAVQILEAEIFRYRTCSGRYCLSMSVGPADLDITDQGGSSDRKLRESNARAAFSKTVETIYSRAIEEMGTGMMQKHLFHPTHSKDIISRPKRRPDRYVLGSFASAAVAPVEDEPSEKQARPKHHDSCEPSTTLRVEDLAVNWDEVCVFSEGPRPSSKCKSRDRCDPMHVDDYIDFRVKPVLQHLEVETQRLVFRQRTAETLSGLLTLVATCLATWGFIAPSASCIAIVGAIQSIAKQQAWSNRLRQANACLYGLTCLVQRWSGLGPLSKRSQAFVDEAVDVTESSMVNMVNAWTAGAASASLPRE